MKKLITKKSVLAVAAPLLIIGALAFAYFWGEYAKSVPVKDYGHGFLNLNKLYSVMKVDSSLVGIDEFLCELDAESKLEIKGSTLSYRGEKLNNELPCFFDSNNYIFIGNKEAQFITSKLKSETIDGTIFYIKDSIYDADYVKQSDRDDLLYKCNDNLFVALKPFEITSTGEKFNIEKYDILLFDGYSIYQATVYDDSFTRSSHGIYEGSCVTIDGKTYAITDFLRLLGLSLDGTLPEDEDDETATDIKPIDSETRTIEEPLYQYFMGYRFDYPAGLNVYSLDGVWYQKREDFTAQLERIPMFYEPDESSIEVDFYAEDEDESLTDEDGEFVTPKDVLEGKRGAYLPAEYILIDPLNSKQYKTPAFAKFYHSNDELLISNGEKTKSVEYGVLYDGDENYFFLEPVTVKWSDTEIKLSSLSSFSIEGGEKISIYDFEKDEFKSYIVHFNDIRIELSFDCVVDVVNKKVRKNGSDLMILGTNPSLYNSFFD